MIHIDFISAECYPSAKVGGLADVVGALPKYINEVKNYSCQVIMPKYGTPWFQNQQFDTIYRGKIRINSNRKHEALKMSVCHFSIEKLRDDSLGFQLNVINLPGLFDRNGVYADENGFFSDEPIRNIMFQRAYLQWAESVKKVNIIHCHDHHTGLIPFFLKYSDEYQHFREIPSFFTIHNGEYHGAFSWDYKDLLPQFPEKHGGLLDWDGGINPLSSAIRCAWKVNTVSPSYMSELAAMPSNLLQLYEQEASKLHGILNGIDYEVWNPATDNKIDYHYSENLEKFKSQNKKSLCDHLNMDSSKTLMSFIGRFATEKGLDLLLESLEKYLTNINVQILVLGTGKKELELKCQELGQKYPDRFKAVLKYDESLAHKIYASSDFLLMPSRIEPCGLNQMYSMRYGTIPIVSSVGGLKDSVVSKGTKQNGIKISKLSPVTIKNAILNALKLKANKEHFLKVRMNAFQSDFSWENSRDKYLKLYDEF